PSSTGLASSPGGRPSFRRAFSRSRSGRAGARPPPLPSRGRGRLPAPRGGSPAVTSVEGPRRLPVSAAKLPPLFGDEVAERVAGIGALDGDLLVILQATRLVPEAVWGLVEA